MLSSCGVKTGVSQDGRGEQRWLTSSHRIQSQYGAAEDTNFCSSSSIIRLTGGTDINGSLIDMEQFQDWRCDKVFLHLALASPKVQTARGTIVETWVVRSCQLRLYVLAKEVTSTNLCCHLAMKAIRRKSLLAMACPTTLSSCSQKLFGQSSMSCNSHRNNTSTPASCGFAARGCSSLSTKRCPDTCCRDTSMRQKSLRRLSVSVPCYRVPRGHFAFWTDDTVYCLHKQTAILVGHETVVNTDWWQCYRRSSDVCPLLKMMPQLIYC